MANNKMSGANTTSPVLFSIRQVQDCDMFAKHLSTLIAKHPHGDVLKPRSARELAGAVLLTSSTGKTLGAVTPSGEIAALISLEHRGGDMLAAQIGHGGRWAVTNLDNPRMAWLLQQAGWGVRFEIPKADGPEPWPGANDHFPLLLWTVGHGPVTVTADLAGAKQTLASAGDGRGRLA